MDIMKIDKQLKECLKQHGITDVREQQKLIIEIVNIFANRR